MKISSIQNNKTSFDRYFTSGYDAKNLEHTLDSFSENLNKITEGFDVVIEMGDSLTLHDKYHDEMVKTYPTTITIEPSTNSAYYTIPKIELQVNHEANPCIGPEYEAKDIIKAIEKGIKLIKSL